MKGEASPLGMYLSMFLLLKVIVFLCICEVNVLAVFTENSLCVFFIKLKLLSLIVISFCFLKISNSSTFPLSEGFCVLVVDIEYAESWPSELLIQKKRSKLNLEVVLASFSWLDLRWKPNLDPVGLLVKQTVTFNCLDCYLRSCFIRNKIMWKMSCGFEDVL